MPRKRQAAPLGAGPIYPQLGAQPAQGSVAVTPADSDLAETFRALYVGGAGDLKLTFADGTVDTFAGVAAGTLLPFSVKRVWNTGTTATAIHGLR